MKFNRSKVMIQIKSLKTSVKFNINSIDSQHEKQQQNLNI
jgi:hypothetical protein